MHLEEQYFRSSVLEDVLLAGELMIRPHEWQYFASSPWVEYIGGGTAECLPGRDQESIQDIALNLKGLWGYNVENDGSIRRLRWYWSLNRRYICNIYG